MTKNPDSTIPPERVDDTVYLIRSEKVVLDHDLPCLYWDRRRTGGAWAAERAAIRMSLIDCVAKQDIILRR